MGGYVCLRLSEWVVMFVSGSLSGWLCRLCEWVVMFVSGSVSR